MFGPTGLSTVFCCIGVDFLPVASFFEISSSLVPVAWKQFNTSSAI